MISFIRVKRLLKNKKLMELGKETGTDFSFLSKAENGDFDLSKSQVERLAKALDIEVDVLMVNSGYLPDSFFFARKDKPEELTKALKKLLKTFEKKYYDKG